MASLVPVSRSRFCTRSLSHSGVRIAILASCVCVSHALRDEYASLAFVAAPRPTLTPCKDFCKDAPTSRPFRGRTRLRDFPQLPGGPGGDYDAMLTKLKRDSQGDPRLCRVLAATVRFLVRTLYGSRSEVTVKARSNRDVLLGRISMLSVEATATAGPLISARGGSLRGTQLDLGLRPLLLLLYLPLLVFGLVDFLSLTVMTLAAYTLVPPASASSSLQYTLSIGQDDINKSFTIRWLLGKALSALMRNSMLVQALGAAAGESGGKSNGILSLKELDKADDYRLTSATLEVSRSAEGLLWGSGRARGRLVMEAVAVLGATPVGQVDSSLAFKLRTCLQAQPAGEKFNAASGWQVAETNQVLLIDPEIFVTPGWPLPDFWLPVGSGVAIDLGRALCLSTLEFVPPGKGVAGGGLNIAGEFHLGAARDRV